MLETYESDMCQVVKFAGCMDTARCAVVEPDLHASLVRPESPVVFDLSEVDFVCSAFLRLCILAYQKTGTLGFRIVNVNPQIKRVFKIAGMDRLLEGE